MASESGVIWENSPLHQYLREIELHVDTRPIPKNVALDSVSIVSRVRNSYISLFTRIVSFFDPDFCGLVHFYAKRVIDSSMMLEDDFAVVQTMAPSIITAPAVRLSPWMYCINALWLSSFALGGILALSSRPQFLVDKRLFAIPFGALVIGFYLRPPSRTPIFQHRRNTAVLERCLKSLEALELSASRSIRFIQEIELVSRGYGISSSLLPPIARLEMASQTRRCVLLRQTIWGSLRRAVHAIREGTRRAMASHPLCGSADYPGYYLACSPNEGISLVGDVEAVRNFTIDFSLTSLKAFYTLFQEYRSEYFRRFCLMMAAECHIDDDDDHKTDDTARISRHLQSVFADVETMLLAVTKIAASCTTKIDRQLALDTGIHLAPRADAQHDDDSPSSPATAPLARQLQATRSSLHTALARTHAVAHGLADCQNATLPRSVDELLLGIAAADAAINAAASSIAAAKQHILNAQRPPNSPVPAPPPAPPEPTVVVESVGEGLGEVAGVFEGDSERRGPAPPPLSATEERAAAREAAIVAANVMGELKAVLAGIQSL